MKRELVRETETAPKPSRLSPFRPDFAPGYHWDERQEIDVILGDCHYFAREAWDKPDTSCGFAIWKGQRAAAAPGSLWRGCALGALPKRGALRADPSAAVRRCRSRKKNPNRQKNIPQPFQIFIIF